MALSEKQIYFLNQNEDSRKVLQREAREDAREWAAARQERLEAEYQKSLKVRAGRLRSEWQESGSGRRVQHQRTGRLVLGDSPLCDGDRLSVAIDKQTVEVTTRYNYTGQLRQISGCFGDTESGESYRLAEGMKARRLEEPAEVAPVGWHMRYKGHLWEVLKGDMCAGRFQDMAEGQALCDLLRAHDGIRPLNDDISFKRM